MDWTLIVVYATGMLLKFHEGSGFQTTSKILLVAEFMALCTRILHLCCMTEFLGPKLVVIRKMVCNSTYLIFTQYLIDLNMISILFQKKSKVHHLFFARSNAISVDVKLLINVSFKP